MKKANSRISILLAIVMMFSMMSSMFAVGVSAAETDPKKIDKFIVDFRTEAALSTNAEIYKHNPTEVEPDPNLGGVYEFDSAKGAMKLVYHECKAQQPYRIMTRVKGLTAEYKYWVLVYSAKSGESYDIYLHNSPSKGVRVDVAKGAKSTDGFVVSDAFDISLLNGEQSILSRWMSGTTVNTINFKSADKNAEFCIKEMGFFKSAEDAKAYYAAVDLSKPASTYGGTAAPTKPADTSATTEATENTFAVNYKVAAEPEKVPSAPTDTSNLPDPVIWKFTDSKEMLASGARLTSHEGFTAGLQKFTTFEDGTKGMELQYCVYKSWKPYRFMPAATSTAAAKPTMDHKYMRITYMTPDLMANTVTLGNNATGKTITLVENTVGSQGKFVRSNAVYIDTEGLLERFAKGSHCTFCYTSPLDTSKFYISEVAFFASPEQAYAYYGDSEIYEGGRFVAMTFGVGGTGLYTVGETYGNVSVNNADNTAVITYAEKTNYGKANYMAKLKFNKVGEVTADHRYVRVLYSADQPENIVGGMYIYNDKGGEIFCVTDKLVDTNGEFVLSPTVRTFADMADRYAGTGAYKNTMHNSLITNVTAKDCTYRIKAIYFFTTREAADAFTPPSSDHKITVNGNDISKYKIVIAEDPPIKLVEAAEIIVSRVSALTGTNLPIVYDNTPESEYEILIGPSKRTESNAKYSQMIAKESGESTLWSYVKGNTVVISAVLPSNVRKAAEYFSTSYLFEGVAKVPAEINLTEKNSFEAIDTSVTPANFWKPYENVADPEKFTEKFTKDSGYFVEENGENNWSIKDGKLVTDTKGYALSYVHVYEADVTYKATLSYEKAGNNGDMGIMLRYNSAYAWIKAGYDFGTGEWYIADREGMDFFNYIRASKKATVKPNTDYKLEFTVDGNSAKLYVNGELMCETDELGHTSPGRVAVYAEDAKVSLDNVELTLLSGLGTVWANVAHTKLPDEVYREGGSVFEMNDGSLIYQHQSTVAFESKDNGVTWTKRDKWTDTYGYVNILRLNNGDWLKIASKGDKKISQTSSDDGKTWVDGGTICVTPFRNDAVLNAGAANMNDKIFQSGTTNRIFYSQNYEVFGKGTFEGKFVFCEFFYSDDNGKTWTKSETDSWEIVGNEDQSHFGECKFLECADGTIRMYNSWNRYGCIVYSDSTDGGKTFGPLQLMEDFVCACSSMQFVRDIYADNATTYYMVWVNSIPESKTSGFSRAGLTLAKSTDGKNWTVLGDVWRWENNYKNNGAFINHVVDPFIKTTEDYILVGSGFSEHTGLTGEASSSDWHQAQRQHIYSIPKASVEPAEKLYDFTDVTTRDSYYEAVKYAVDNGLFNGTSATTFDPDVTMNRAMFVTVLGRLDKADVSKYTTPTFDDVKAGEWYTSYVEWAAANGIVNGMGGGKYGVTGTITVEQACTILYRYANGKTAANASGKNVSDFTDNASVSAWAADGIKWAVENGIYAGQGSVLNPTDAASRALVATMFANYVREIGA